MPLSLCRPARALPGQGRAALQHHRFPSSYFFFVLPASRRSPLPCPPSVTLHRTAAAAAMADLGLFQVTQFELALHMPLTAADPPRSHPAPRYCSTPTHIASMQQQSMFLPPVIVPNGSHAPTAVTFHRRTGRGDWRRVRAFSRDWNLGASLVGGSSLG